MTSRTEEQKALEKADATIRDLVTGQEQIFKPEIPNAENGRALGDFIAALRDRLAEMYRKTPN